jgi:hypothetical protein
MDNEIMNHILKNMISNYELQLEVIEKCIHDKLNPFSIKNIRDDSKICFKILNLMANEESKDEVVEDLTLLGELVENVGPANL